MNDRMAEWFCGDQNAVAFAATLWDAIQRWDDVEDEGRCEDHNAMVAWWAFGKEYDPFFSAHAAILRPVLTSMYLQWRAANVLDRGSREDVEKAYMLRAAYYSVLQMIAACCGGLEHAALIGPEIFRSYGETVDSLWREFNPCPTP